ncbi:hypothetical protein CEV32_4260 [Brucella rhizosphaerae]|uniref:Uncharacterized protein n=1 Tax=Brucella rhizosphaerae TaxID=571254 RepID=A0A256FP71_9HYPH|nr:hypothetical protein CEV32_4260 [Brucella rhizosphaerae]
MLSETNSSVSVILDAKSANALLPVQTNFVPNDRVAIME